ncbi:hypothetical protein [Methylopila turkensis]|uniref:Uncharacterized protein n=1 Tax=Methylopila turkensis TaxID=1437816 RepID=A0A9W6N819_9HYPH|nr:hypothetical protein [Methylopila turkensis]GLK81864.1 hypothetical protein GCM10008174_36050 [Methylopila turkensis]
MGTVSRDDAVTAFEPYFPIIRKAIDDAFAEWRAIETFRVDSGFGPSFYDRTKSNEVFDGIAKRAILRLGAEPGILVDIEAQTFKFAVKGIAARFKKAGDDKLGQNVTTQAVLAFVEADGELPGLGASGKVEFVWRPNDLWTRIDRVLMIARDGDQLLWEYEIEGEASSVIELPASPPPSSPASDDLVKPKVKPSKKTQDQ